MPREAGQSQMQAADVGPPSGAGGVANVMHATAMKAVPNCTYGHLKT